MVRNVLPPRRGSRHRELYGLPPDTVSVLLGLVPAAGKWEGNRPVAVIGQERMSVRKRALGDRSRTVRLSRWTADKQWQQLPDEGPGDYRLVRRILNSSDECYVRRRDIIAFLQEGNHLRCAVVKVTRDGAESDLNSSSRALPRYGKSMRRQWPTLEELSRNGAVPVYSPALARRHEKDLLPAPPRCYPLMERTTRSSIVAMKMGA